MAAKKKRLKNLVESVSAILGDEQKWKKLRKARSLERFIAKMEAKKLELEQELAKDEKNNTTAHQLILLSEQIKKAKGILKDIQ